MKSVIAYRNYHLNPVYCFLIMIAGGLFISLSGTPCWGQTPFALKNIGQNNGVADARILGRGGWGMTVQDTLAPGFKNLAGLAGINKVTFQLTGFGQSVSTEAADADRSTFRTYAPNIRVAFPMLSSRAALTAGFRVRRSSQYRAQQELSLNAWGDEVNFYELFVRDGTQFEVPLGIAGRLGGGVAIGFSVNLIRGTMIETLDDVFWESDVGGVDQLTSYPFVRSRRELKDIFDGTSTTFSLLWNPVGGLKFGAAYTPRHNVVTARTLSLASVASRKNSSFTVWMPVEWSVGTQIPLSSRWRFGADFDLCQFSQLRGRWEWEQDMKDERTFSCGFERIRGQLRRGGSSNLPLRIGFSQRNWGYLVNEHEIVERSMSVGIGFPLHRHEGQVDIASTYGIIGDLSDNGSSSKYIRFSVTITGLEKWW